MGYSLNSRITMQGDKELEKALFSFFEETTDTSSNIVEFVSRNLEEYIKRITPVGEGKKGGKYPHPPATLRDSISVGYVGKDIGWTGTRIGVEKNQYFLQNDGYYARFVEFGTKYSEPAPTREGYIRYILRTKRNETRKYIENELKRRLRLSD